MTMISNRHFRNKIFITIVSVLFLLFFVNHSNREQQEKVKHEKKNILILCSYHENLVPTKRLVKGIINELNHKFPMEELELYIEYMDTKRKYKPSSGDPDCINKNIDFEGTIFEELFALYRKKFLEGTNKTKFDVIISLDDNAWCFLVTYRNELFKGVPIVFCGLNYAEVKKEEFRKKLKEKKFNNYTGIFEMVSIKQTIILAKKLQPEIKEIYAINDYHTTTGRINSRLLKNIISDLNTDKSEYKDLKITLNKDITLEELKDELKSLPRKKSIVLLSGFNVDSKNNIFSYQESLREIYESSAVPIYGLADHFLHYNDEREKKNYNSHGIIGGKLLITENHGKRAAELASKILNGESADEIPLIDEMTEDQYEYRLDYNKLKKFEISLSKLEELKKQNYKIKVINEPLSFFKKYQKELTITSVSFRKTGRHQVGQERL